MINRCYEPRNAHFKYYGLQGIRVCTEWANCIDGYENFEMWAEENGYADNLTIDRIDGKSDYCPKNCRWVDMYVQNNNTQKNRYITYNGETKTAAEWGRAVGISGMVIANRIRRGWEVSKAMTQKPKAPKAAKAKS